MKNAGKTCSWRVTKVVNHLKSLEMSVHYNVYPPGSWKTMKGGCCCANQQAQVISSIFRIIVSYCFTLWRDIDAMILKTQIKVKVKQQFYNEYKMHRILRFEYLFLALRLF